MSNFAVVGSGAIGVVIAYKLKQLNLDANVFGRGGVLTKQVEIIDPSGRGSPFLLSAKRSPEKKPSIVFFPVKAGDLDKAIDQHIHEFQPGSILISVCNGYVVDVIEKKRAKYANFHWRVGSTNVGVRKANEHTFVISNPGGTLQWGSPWQEAQTTSEEALHDKGGFFQWSEDILLVVRRKWLFNSVMNSITAAQNLKSNGLLFSYMDQVDKAFDEAYRLGEELWGNWSVEREILYQDMLSLIRATSENENSMVRDLRLGKKTESDFLAGLAFKKENYQCLRTLHATITKTKN